MASLAVCSAFETAAAGSSLCRGASGLAKRAEIDVRVLPFLHRLKPAEWRDLRRYEQGLQARERARRAVILPAYITLGPLMPALSLAGLLISARLKSKDPLPPLSPGTFSGLATTSLLYSLYTAPIAYSFYKFLNWLDRKTMPLPLSLQKYVVEQGSEEKTHDRRSPKRV